MRQQFIDRGVNDLAGGAEEQHFGIRAKFLDHLPAGTAGRDRQELAGAIGGADGDGGKLKTRPFGAYRGGNRIALGATADVEGAILDVAAGVDLAVGRAQCGADSEFLRIRRVSLFQGQCRFVEQILVRGHDDPWSLPEVGHVDRSRST